MKTGLQSTASVNSFLQAVPDRDLFADALRSALDQCQADRMTEARGERTGGDIALVVFEGRGGTLGEDMGAGAEAGGRIERFDADETAVAPARSPSRASIALPMKSGLVAETMRPKPRSPGVTRAVDLGMGDMTLLDAHDAKRLDTIGADAVLLPRRA